MVAGADTRVQPLTMMVKSMHTLVADEAVARLWRPYNLTFWANIALVKMLIQFQER
jgi:hypothetical protein